MDYLCIDLKCFYASVECIERGLDPFSTALVVADESKGSGSICLAVSPYMKSLGVKSRSRLFEIPKTIDFIIAKPRMKKYIEYSSNIYEIYLQFVAKEDIHVYSIDEVFIDITTYQKMYQKTPFKIGKMIADCVYKKTKIFATCGVGKNLFLAKIAMDMVAKKVKEGIAFLDEDKFKEKLWDYQPLHDFWQIGHGIEKRLNKLNIYTMREIANADPKVLFKEFGVNAQFLIDHSQGLDDTTMEDIKNYVPRHRSISSGQMLERDYTFSETRLALKEMIELSSLDLIEQQLVTDTVSLSLMFSKTNKSLSRLDFRCSKKLNVVTNSFEILSQAILRLYDEKVDKTLLIRKISIGFSNLEDETHERYDLFTDFEKVKKEKEVLKTIVELKKRYGKSAVIRGMNLDENATTLKRNKLTGGHNSE